jgi:hypothetical protein
MGCDPGAKGKGATGTVQVPLVASAPLVQGFAQGAVTACLTHASLFTTT